MTINKEISKIAFPNILANISIPLLGIVDTALMGRNEDSAYIGAIALGGIIFNILYWGFGFLRPGTTGLTAQAFGRNETPETYRLFYRSVIIAIGIGLTILIFRNQIASFCFLMLSGTEEVERLALQYFSIRVLAAPAVIALISMRGWFFGIQDAISPMILTILANLLNIVLSYYLVVHRNMSVEGVAYGTMWAQWLTFLVASLIILFRHRLDLLRYFDEKVFKRSQMRRFFTVNRDMFIRNMGLIFVFTFFTNHASKVNNDYLAVSQILIQLFYFMSYAVDGFAYASESLVGKYLGASNYPKIKEVISKCMIMGLSLATAFALVYLIWDEAILRIFTNNEALILESQKYMIWLSLLALTGALAFIWDGVFSGGTASVELRNSMLFAVLIFGLVFLAVRNYYPLHAIWAAMVGFMAARSLFQWYYYEKYIRLRWENNEI